MRAIVTVTSICNESAGPSYTVPSLCDGLSRNGLDVELHVLDRVPDVKRSYAIHTYSRSSFPTPRIGRSPAMFRSLKAAVADSDIIHSNGIWAMPEVYPAIVKRGTKCKLVFSPRGGLSGTALRRSVLQKFVFGHFFGQYRALRETDMFHAASIKEMLEIRELGYDQPIALVPNGIDVPNIEHSPFKDGKRKLAFLGRIHETKAVDHLVAAWGNVAEKFPDWSLEIAGPDYGARSKVEELVASRCIPRASFIGELHGMEKYRFLASADLYVLPSLTENFAITIAEALACGTPVIASRGCPWERLEEKGCGWWIDIGVDALTAQLERSLSVTPECLQTMGAIGRCWMSIEYSWDTVAKRMADAYRWLCDGGEKPACIK